MEIAEVFELSTLDYFLFALLAILVYRWFRRRADPEPEGPKPIVLPPFEKQDMTITELRKYNGVQDQRILFALNGTIYDVSRGRSFYGPGGPYGDLAGHDATRSLGTMNSKAVKDEWDDHEDLKPDEREQADEWEASFKFKYPTVGRLVRNAEDKNDYAGEMSKIADWNAPAAKEE